MDGGNFTRPHPTAGALKAINGYRERENQFSPAMSPSTASPISNAQPWTHTHVSNSERMDSSGCVYIYICVLACVSCELRENRGDLGVEGEWKGCTCSTHVYNSSISFQLKSYKMGDLTSKETLFHHPQSSSSLNKAKAFSGQTPGKRCAGGENLCAPLIRFGTSNTDGKEKYKFTVSVLENGCLFIAGAPSFHSLWNWHMVAR